MNVNICVSGWLDEDDPVVHGVRRSWSDTREYLRAFYRTANPEKANQVDQVLDRYKGFEDEFFFGFYARCTSSMVRKAASATHSQ